MNSKEDSPALNARHVQRRFDRAAASFDDADFVHAATRAGLLQRLEPMVVKAKTVIDLGSATGSGLRTLARRFRGAQIIATDLSYNMLRQARKKQPWFTRHAAIQANAESLPIADMSVDVVFSNLLLPWIPDPARLFAEVSRVLQKDGLFIFSTLGPDSLSELRDAWPQTACNQHVNRFTDMHDIGDAAVRAGFRDPVLDVDRLSITYADAAALFRDLTAMGARNSLQRRERSLRGASGFRAMMDALNEQRSDGILNIDLEIIYGHCWGSGPRSADSEYRIDAERIGRRPIRSIG